MSFWTLIFALSMAFIVAIVVTTLLKVQANFRPPDVNDGLSAREAERILTENEQLKQKVAELTERLIVLERIATDPADRATSGFVGRRDEQHVVATPNRRRAIEIVAGIMRVRPQDRSRDWIQRGHRATSQEHQLRRACELDQDGRRTGGEEIAALPHHAAVALAKGHDRLPRSTDTADDGVAKCNRTAAVAGLHHRTDQQLGRLEILDEIVRPEDLAAPLVEGEHLLVRPDAEEPVADDERCRMRSSAKAEIFTARRVFVFPERLARLGIERDDAFLRVPWPGRPSPAAGTPAVAATKHRVEATLVEENRRVSAAEWPAPNHRRPALRPGVGQTRISEDEVPIRSAPLPPRGWSRLSVEAHRSSDRHDRRGKPHQHETLATATRRNQ